MIDPSRSTGSVRGPATRPGAPAPLAAPEQDDRLTRSPARRDRRTRVSSNITPVGGDALARERRYPVRLGPAVDRPGYFDYTPALDRADAVEWHVNFADPHLFVAYGSRLFAQDEMQVAEHPALGSLKEALDARDFRA